MISADFETRSPAKLKDVGAYKYACDPATEIMSLAWAYDDEPHIHLWHPAYPDIPEEGADELAELHERLIYGEEFHAHNAFFERSIWYHVGVRKLGWAPLDPRQIRCTAALAASYALPRKLEKAVEALKLPFPKDMKGHRLMLKMSRPRKPYVREMRAVGLGKGDEAEFTRRFGLRWYEGEEDLRRLFDYNRQDVRAERGLAGALRPLPPKEVDVWLLDQEINWRGIAVDVEGIDNALRIVAEFTERANRDMRDLTGGAVPGCTKRNEFLAWCETQNVYLPNTQKETIAEWCGDATLPADVRRALRLWSSANQASVKKYQAMRNRVCDDGRVRDILVYSSAGTGRWAGQGVQPQNFKRGFSERDPRELTA